VPMKSKSLNSKENLWRVYQKQPKMPNTDRRKPDFAPDRVVPENIGDRHRLYGDRCGWRFLDIRVPNKDRPTPPLSWGNRWQLATRNRQKNLPERFLPPLHTGHEQNPAPAFGLWQRHFGPGSDGKNPFFPIAGGRFLPPSIRLLQSRNIGSVTYKLELLG